MFLYAGRDFRLLRKRNCDMSVLLFSAYMKISWFFFFPACEMHLKNFLHRVWELSGLFFEL